MKTTNKATIIKNTRHFDKWYLAVRHANTKGFAMHGIILNPVKLDSTYIQAFEDSEDIREHLASQIADIELESNLAYIDIRIDLESYSTYGSASYSRHDSMECERLYSEYNYF